MASITRGFAESGHLPFGDYVLHVANFSSFIGRFEYSFVRQTSTDVTTQRGEEETISPYEEWWHKFSVNSPSTFFSLQVASSEGIAVEIIQLCSAVDLAMVSATGAAAAAEAEAAAATAAAAADGSSGGYTRAISLTDGNYILRVVNPSGQVASVGVSVERSAKENDEALVLSSPIRELEAQSTWWRKFVVENATRSLEFTLRVASTGNTIEEVLLLGPILILDPFPMSSSAEAGARVPGGGVSLGAAAGIAAYSDPIGNYNYDHSKFSPVPQLSQFQGFCEAYFPPTGPLPEFQLFRGPPLREFPAADTVPAQAPDSGGLLTSLDEIKRFLHNPYVTANNYTGIGLVGQTLTHESVDRLGEYLTTNLIVRRITALLLIDSGVDDEMLIRLLSGLSSSMVFLDLSVNDITDNGIVALSALLATADYNLQHISLRGNKVGDLGASALSDALMRNSTVLSLDMSDNEISLDGAKQLQQGIRINDSLKSFCFAGNDVGDDVVDLLARLAPVRLVDHVQWSWRHALDARSMTPVRGEAALGPPLAAAALAPGKINSPIPLYAVAFTDASKPASSFVVVPRSVLEPGTMSLSAVLAGGQGAWVTLPDALHVASFSVSATSNVAVVSQEGPVVVYSGLALARAVTVAADIPGGVVDCPPLVVIEPTVLAPCVASSAQILFPRMHPGSAGGQSSRREPTMPAARKALLTPKSGAGPDSPWTVPQDKDGVTVVQFAWVPVLDTVPCEAALLYADGTPAIVSGGVVSALGSVAKASPICNVVALAWGIAPMAQSHMTPRAVLAMGTADGRLILQRPTSSMLLANLDPPPELNGLHAAAHLRFLGGDVWLVGFVSRAASYVFALVHLKALKGGAVNARWRVLGPQLFPVASAARLGPGPRFTHAHVPLHLYSQLADATSCVKISLSLPFPRLLLLGSSISPDVEVLTSTSHSDPLHTWRVCALPNSTLFSPPSSAASEQFPRTRPSAVAPVDTPIDFEDGMLGAMCFPLSMTIHVETPDETPPPTAGSSHNTDAAAAPAVSPSTSASAELADAQLPRYEYEYEYEYEFMGSGGADPRRHMVYSRRSKPHAAMQRADDDPAACTNLSTVETLHHLHLELPCVRVALMCVLRSGHVLEYEFVVRQEKAVDQGFTNGDVYDVFAAYQVARKRNVSHLDPPSTSSPLVNAATSYTPPASRSSPLDFVDHTVGGLFDSVYVDRR